MYDGGKIIFGLLVFVIVMTFPIWYPLARGETGELPAVELPDKTIHPQCVIPDAVKMRESHMQLLMDWRDEVVREGKRMYEIRDAEGNVLQTVEKSLTNTCLDCHASKANFCDRCHEYADVKPYCWDCHIDTTARRD